MILYLELIETILGIFVLLGIFVFVLRLDNEFYKTFKRNKE